MASPVATVAVRGSRGSRMGILGYSFGRDGDVGAPYWRSASAIEGGEGGVGLGTPSARPLRRAGAFQPAMSPPSATGPSLGVAGPAAGVRAAEEVPRAGAPAKAPPAAAAAAPAVEGDALAEITTPAAGAHSETPAALETEVPPAAASAAAAAAAPEPEPAAPPGAAAAAAKGGAMENAGDGPGLPGTRCDFVDQYGR